MKRYLSIVLILCLTFSLFGCGTKQAVDVPEEDEGEIVEDVVDETTKEEQAILSYMETMSLEERVGQLFFVRAPYDTGVEDQEQYQAGGYLLFWRNIKDHTAESLTEEIASYQAVSKTPLFIGVDEEGGSVTRVSLNPNLRNANFNSPRVIYANGGTSALTANTAEKDSFLQFFGFNVNFAPVCDVCTTEDAYMYARSMGVDAKETATCITTIVSQMNTDGMGSVLKHFPGYGDVADTHFATAGDDRPIESFREKDFLPFEAGILAGANFILTSHNIVSCINPNLPASLAPETTELLRNELGFNGLIITDDLVMAGAADFATEEDTAVQAIRAGNDMVVSTDFTIQIPAVIDAVKNGTLSEETINTACSHVLMMKLQMGLLEIDYD